METPQLDRRTAGDVVDEAVSLARNVYLPGVWQGFQTPEDPAFRLIGVFGRMMEILIERLNRAPEKNFLAFLEMVGVEPSPGAPASAPVTFLPSAKAMEGGFIPAGTQVATTQTDATDALVFETRSAIYATPAKLAAALNLLPAADKYAPVPLPALPPGPRDLEPSAPDGAGAAETVLLSPDAAGLSDLPHALYLGSASLFGRKEVLDVTLRFTIASGDASILNGANLQWRKFDKDAKDWVATGAVYVPAPPGEALVVLSLFGGNEKTAVGGSEEFWVACVFAGDPAAAASLEIASVEGALKPAGAAPAASALPEKAFADSLALDTSKPFRPFGDRPRYGDAFYLACARALAPEAGEITVSAALKAYSTAQLQAAFKDVPAITSLVTRVQWQYSAADGSWKNLTEFLHTLTATPGAPGNPPAIALEIRRDGVVTSSDDGSFFGQAGTNQAAFTFDRPADMGFLEFQGEENFWIRALLKSEDPYGKDAYIASASPLVIVGASLIPPVVEELALGFTYKSAFEAVPRAISENNLGRTDHAYGGNVPVYPMRPFAPASVQDAGDVPAAFAGGHGLYLGFDRPFGEAHISWYFRLRDGFPSVDRPAESGEPLLAWEYLALDRAWKPLDVEDGTAHLTGSGTVAFAGPSDSLAAALFPAGPPPVHQSLHWFRARLVSGRYDYPPALRGVYPNTVMADNRTTFRGDLILGSGSGERGQRLRLPKAPVLSGWLWVRESEAPPAAELDALTAELSADGADLGPVSGAVSPPSEASTVISPHPWSGVLEIREFPDGRDREAWVLWRRVPNFLASGPRSRHYALDPLSGEVILGDGLRAMMPPVIKDNLLFRGFRTGGGEAANQVAAPMAIKELKSSLPYVDKVFNVEPAVGGANPWGMEEILAFGPQLIKNKGRAVTAEDFEWMTLQRFSALARAKCLSTRAPGPAGLVFRPGAVTMVVVPKSRDRFPRPSSALLEAVRGFLAEQALGGIASGIHALGPGFTEVTVSAMVRAGDPQENSEVERRCQKALEDFFHPLYGGETGTGWAFGRDVALSEVYAVLQRVEGVDYVGSAGFPSAPGTEALDIGDNNLVASGAHSIEMI